MSNKAQDVDDDIPDEDWDYLISKPRVFSVWAFDPDNPLELDQTCLRFEDHQEKGLQIKVIGKNEVSKDEVIPCIIEKDVILPLNWKKNGFPDQERNMMILGCKLLQAWSNQMKAEKRTEDRAEMAQKFVKSLPKIARKRNK